MSPQVIAAVTIGQAPRPDLLEPLLDRVGRGTTIVELGALDDIACDGSGHRIGQPDGPGSYPLTTRLRDGSSVTLDEGELAPLVQKAVNRATDGGADVVLLLCAGGFLEVRAEGTLVRPFEAAVETAVKLSVRRMIVVVPFEGQARGAQQKWEAAGFEVQTIVGDLAGIELPFGVAVDAIVLDYVGHPTLDVQALRAVAPVPVIDLGECGAEAALAALGARERAALTGQR